MNQAYSRLSTTHGHITDCKLDSVVYVGVCVAACVRLRLDINAVSLKVTQIPLETGRRFYGNTIKSTDYQTDDSKQRDAQNRYEKIYIFAGNGAFIYNTRDTGSVCFSTPPNGEGSRHASRLISCESHYVMS